MRSLVIGLAVFALGLVTAALVISPRAGAHASAGSLSATVGPGFTIGMSASTVTPGDYTINVDDKSNAHNFHISGPGVDKSTSITGTGSTSWDVTLTAGTYHFQCDAHASSMNGDLVVADDTTSPATTTTASTTQAPPPPARPTVRITSAHATPKLVTVNVTSSRAGRAVADLFARTQRVAHATGRAPGTLHLRPARPLKPGRYVVKLRVTTGGTTIATQRVVQVA